MDKIYKRIEDGTTTYVSVSDAMVEVNDAMMEGKREVRTMSSGHGQHSIAYRDGRKVTLALVDATSAIQSGYTSCACRDCFDVTTSSDTSKPELCGECEEAGCEPLPMHPFPGMLMMFNCQRDDAYEG